MADGGGDDSGGIKGERLERLLKTMVISEELQAMLLKKKTK